ncbi:MAG: hypothetical protein V3S01_07930, partial [Dehalococcoidia bacterium]
MNLQWLRDSQMGWRGFQKRQQLVDDGIPGPATLYRVLEMESTFAAPVTLPPQARTHGRSVD